MVHAPVLRSILLLKGSGRRNKLGAVLAIELLFTSCTASSEGFSGGPIVSVIDSVVLREPDSVVVGRFANVTHDRLGRTYLADLTGGRVVRFNRDGTFDGTIGRSGAGPGELQAAARHAEVALDRTPLAIGQACPRSDDDVHAGVPGLIVGAGHGGLAAVLHALDARDHEVPEVAVLMTPSPDVPALAIACQRVGGDPAHGWGRPAHRLVGNL